MNRDLVFRWADDGLLPTFKRLIDESASGLVENPKGLVSGSAWSSFYNGTSPDRHGQYDAYERFDPDGYGYVRSTKQDLTYDPLWEVLSRAGRRVAVIDAPYAYLADDLNGIQVVDWCTHVRLHEDAPRTIPVGLAAEIQSRFGNDPLGTEIGSPCDQRPPRSVAEFSDFRDKLCDRVARRTDLIAHVLQDGSWDFFLAAFTEPHCTGHHCWHIHDERHELHDPGLRQAIGDPVKDVYRAIDQSLARLLALRDADTTLLIYANIGMGPHHSGTDLLDQILLRLEGIDPPEKRERATDAIRQLWRRAPRGLRDLFMPIRRHVWEPIYQQAIVPDRATRRFFEMKTNHATGGVRVNLIGRESRGLVRPGAEYDAVLDRLTEQLKSFVNADSGEPLVLEVLRTDRLYPGPHRDKLPDLLVQWNRTAPIVRARSPETGLVENRHLSARVGDHDAIGFFLVNGPDIPHARLQDRFQAVDFAPSIAAFLGVDLPSAESKPAPVPLEAAAFRCPA